MDSRKEKTSFESNSKNQLALLLLLSLVKDTMPIMGDAQAKSVFMQSKFIEHINSIEPKIKLNPLGICHGLTQVSFGYNSIKMENLFVKTLEEFQESKEMTQKQLNILTMLKDAQEQSSDEPLILNVEDRSVVIIKIGVKEIPIAMDKLHASISDSLDEAFECAITNFGDEISYIIQGPTLSHVISFLAKNENDQLIIKIDDANFFLEAKYNDYASLKKDLITHILNHYCNYFLETVKINQTPSVRIEQYNAVTDLEEKDQGQGMTEWLVKSKHQFFKEPKSINDSTFHTAINQKSEKNSALSK